MMSTAILIIGESGTGKSTSVENLDPSETFIINVKGKNLPFKGSKTKYTLYSKDNPKGNYFITEDAKVVGGILDHVSKEMSHIKNIIIDDFQYVAASEFMAKADQTGFAKFTSIAKNIYSMADKASKLREDLFVVYMNHAEESTDLNGDRRIKAKTAGKLIDNAITLEGLFTYVIYTNVKNNKGVMEYSFLTQNDGSNTAKSPKGCLDLKEPNDLKVVIDKIKRYNN